MAEAQNFTSVKEFILLGLTSHRKIQLLLFGVILVIYLLTVLGNLLIIVLVKVGSNLQTPMYYFLSHLAWVDMCYITTTMPLMLTQLLTGDGAISLPFCMAQIYIAVALGGVEILLLGVMAYDRYLAICHPLLYPVLMDKSCQLQCSSTCWIAAPLVCVIYIVFLLRQDYCGPNRINNFMCEMPVVLKLACGDTKIAEAVIFGIGGLFLLVPLSIVLASYGFILHSVLQMKSSGRRKAFSTCASHLTVISMFYGPLLWVYIIPKTDSAADRDKEIAIFYVLITPLLNSVIYTLRKKGLS